MEYWSVEKKGINPFGITPILQYSNIPKLINLKATTMDYPLLAYRSVFLDLI